MKIKTFYVLSIAVIILLSQSGCKKFSDYFEQVKENKPANYQIKNISFAINLWDNGFKNYHFFYDDKKRLTKIEFGEYDRYEFTYDAKNRVDKIYLLDYEAKYGSFVRADKYIYRDSVSIIDSIFYDGQTSGPLWGIDYAVKLLKLDTKGRVIWEKVTAATKYSGEILGRIVTYTYDVDGNRVIPGVTYTKKPALRRLNDMFMLLDRNYSINTAADESSEFNTAGLPVKLKRNKRDFLSFGYSNIGKLKDLPDPIVEYNYLP